jgi:Uma2 family endonuclease
MLPVTELPPSVATQTPRRRFTVDEVMRMVETGLIGEDEPLELLDGELLVVGPQGHDHRFVCDALGHALTLAYAPRAYVSHEKPLRCGDYSLPLPDLALLHGVPHRYATGHPLGGDVFLAIEVSVTSQALDHRKIGIYAAAGVATYWLIDVKARRVEVHDHPDPSGRYLRVQILGEEDMVDMPLLGVQWPVAKLLGPMAA